MPYNITKRASEEKELIGTEGYVVCGGGRSMGGSKIGEFWVKRASTLGG